MQRSLVLLLLLVAINVACVDNNTSSDRPANVILIMTDDQGYGEIGAHGNPTIRTPNLDKLHAESIRLTDFHVSPTCSPTRAALMTGHYTNRTGAWHTVAGRSQLRENEVTMAEVFNQNGYSTAIFGKWHLGDNYPFRPQDRGFDEVLIHGGGGVGQQPDYWGNDYFNDTYFHNGVLKKFEGYCTDVWFNSAIRYIEDRMLKNEPFFCYISTNAPHDPFLIADNYRQKYKGDTSLVSPAFYGMIENIDDNIGNLLAYMDDRQLTENTIVIFMSDNGTAIGAQQDLDTKKILKGYNAGMRGTKNTEYEGGHRVPFFIRWPQGGLLGGKDINTLSAHIDVLPTLIDLLGLEVDQSLKFDGQSLRYEFLGENSLEGQRTIITDSQREEIPKKWKASSTMRGKWRLINGTELYNIERDPGQEFDVANENPEMMASLRADYEKWWEELEPSFSEMTPIILGSDYEPETTLYAFDMHVDEDYYRTVPWHQRHIRSGNTKSMGWWAVRISNPGMYRMTFFRWPSSLQLPITAPAPELEGEPGTNFDGYPAGRALEIKEANLKIGEFEQSIEVGSDDVGIGFEVPLERGEMSIEGWFTDNTDRPFAPNYIEIERIQ